MKNHKQQTTYFQNELLWVAESVFTLVLSVGSQLLSLFLLIFENTNGYIVSSFLGINIIPFAIAISVLSFIAYPELLARFSWNIHLDDSKIWMNGDWSAQKWWRTQYFTEISFSEIVSIHIECSTKNNRGQSIVAWMYGPIWSKKTYLVFTVASKKKKRINISHFTITKLDIILSEIIHRIHKQDNYNYDERAAADVLIDYRK